ncbi:MAG: hypothetical protein AAF436_01570 [Myxococcota bacterium]
MLTPSDEHWHPSTGQAHWNESFYFNGFDEAGGWGLATRIGATPGAHEQDGFVCLYLPGGETAFVELAQSLEPEAADVACEGLEFTCVEPFRRWRLRYEGLVRVFDRPAHEDDLRRSLDLGRPARKLELDLEVAPLHDAVDYDKRSVRPRPAGDVLKSTVSRSPLQTIARTARAARMLPSMTGAHHYEQATRVRGTVRLDGELSTLDGSGQRDHSWGVRDMRVPARWRWLSCQFGDALCFNAVQVDVLAMRVQSGFVLHDDRLEPIMRLDLRETQQPGGLWPTDVGATLTTDSEREFEVRARILAPLPVVARSPDRSTLVTASRAQFEWDGHVAEGMVEAMEQLR